MFSKRNFDFISLLFVIFCSLHCVFCESSSYTIGIQRNRSLKPLKDTSRNTIFSDFCGGIFRDKQVVIKSPRYPNSYPKNLECDYTFYSPFVCMNEFHIQFLHFQLEPSMRCTKDKLVIGEDEILCGQVIGIMKYQANNGTLRIKFTSDETIENTGFELVVTRLPCSLNGSNQAKWNETATITSIFGNHSEAVVRNLHVANSTSQTNTEIVSETSIVRPICLSQTKTQPNQHFNPKNTFNRAVSTSPTLPSCCINIFNQNFFYLISPGFPNIPQHPTDCVFHVERNHANICRLRIGFKFFLLGDIMQQRCVTNFLEIDGHRFCGCRTGFIYYSQWGKPSTKSIRFSNLLRYERIQGFILEIIQEECPYKSFQQFNMPHRLSPINHLMHANDPRRCSSNYVSWLNLNTNQQMLAKSVCVRNYGWTGINNTWTTGLINYIINLD